MGANTGLETPRSHPLRALWHGCDVGTQDCKMTGSVQKRGAHLAPPKIGERDGLPCCGEPGGEKHWNLALKDTERSVKQGMFQETSGVMKSVQAGEWVWLVWPEGRVHIGVVGDGAWECLLKV